MCSIFIIHAYSIKSICFHDIRSYFMLVWSLEFVTLLMLPSSTPS
uniref:Uncharacterized protein n=1 Tax=Anguilla anguilla TaxID=7936 RepID=A0A0E9W2M7_ANGAN